MRQCAPLRFADKEGEFDRSQVNVNVLPKIHVKTSVSLPWAGESWSALTFSSRLIRGMQSPYWMENRNHCLKNCPEDWSWWRLEDNQEINSKPVPSDIRWYYMWLHLGFSRPILMSLFLVLLSYCCSFMLRFFIYFVFLKSRRPFRCLLPRRGFHLDSLPLNSGWWRAAVMVDLLEPIPICTQNLWRSAKVITGFLTWNVYTQIVQFVPTNSSETSPSPFKLLPFRSVGSRSAPRNFQECQNQINFPTSVPLKFDLWALVEGGLISHFGLWWHCQQWDLLQVCIFKKSRLISWTHHSCNVPGPTICAKAIFQGFF